MKPRRIILVRHAQSVGNVDPHIYATIPDHALPITDHGVTQAREAGRALRELIGGESVHFWMSPYKRTLMTFEHMVQGFDREQVCRASSDWRLREQDWGNLRERSATQVLDREREAFGTAFYRFPNGESGADVYDRVGDFINSLHRDFDWPEYTADNVVIVTHGFTARMFLCRWFHWSPAEFEAVRNLPNCGRFVMERYETNGRQRYKLTTPLNLRREIECDVLTTLGKFGRDARVMPYGVVTAKVTGATEA
jgi:broad specificity phosphatase PhoE